jgi:hypothetical protein
VVIINPELLKKRHHALREFEWDYIVFRHRSSVTTCLA